MKTKKLLAITALLGCLGTSLTGCGKGVAAGGEATIQIRAYKGGYGVDWLKELIKHYEKAFPEHKVELVEASSMVVEPSVQEIQTPKKNQIDLYFLTGGSLATFIGKSKQVLHTNTQTLLEDLTDVYNSKAIGFDGKEEKETIASRMFDGYYENCSYHGYITNWQDRVYRLPWADGMTGIIANTRVLAKYGIEIPLTSNEFAAAIKTIASHTATDKIYPYSWAGSNAPGYWSYLFETWFAQYSGSEAFMNFMKCQPKEGTIEENGYEVYKDKGILKGLEAMYEILDLDYSSDGSASKTHMEAQNEFFLDKSAFIVDGDWVFNEMKAEYYEEAKDCVMIQTPILSCLGEENGLTDAQLHDVIKGIDEGKSNTEIKGLVAAATDKAIDKIRDARAIHDGIGTGHNMYIPSYSDAKEAAKNFIRFMYSNDGCRLFRNYALANLPLSYTTEEGDSNTPYQQSLDKIYASGKTQMVSSAAEYNDVREATLMLVFNVTEWSHPNTYKTIMLDKYQSKVLSPQKIYEGEARYMEQNWASYMEYLY